MSRRTEIGIMGLEKKVLPLLKNRNTENHVRLIIQMYAFLF